MSRSYKAWGLLKTSELRARKRRKHSGKNSSNLLAARRRSGFEQLEDRRLLSSVNTLDAVVSTLSDNTPLIKGIELASATNMISLRYDLPKLLMEPISNTPEGRIIAEAVMPGTSQSCQVGEPILPLLPVEIVVPQGRAVGTIGVIPDGQVTLGEQYLIPPRTEPLTISTGLSSMAGGVAGVVDHGSSDGRTLSASLFDVVGFQEKRGVEILRVNLNPVEYAVDTGKVSYYTALTLNVNLIDADPGASAGSHTIRYRPDEIQPLEKDVANPGALAGYAQAALASGPPAPGDCDPSQTFQYVAITSQAMVNATTDYTINDLIAYKQSHGMTATAVTLESIYAGYSGVDQAEKIRNFIIDAYNNWETDFVLLGGDTSVVPYRSLWVDMGMSSSEQSIPSDLYFQCLDGNYNFDGDTHWGEPNDGPGGGDVDLSAEVYVGRVSAENANEMANWVYKEIAFEDTAASDYRLSAMMVGEYLGFGGVSDYATDSMEEIRLGSSAHGYTTAGFASEPTITTSTLYDSPSYTWSANDLMNLFNSGNYGIYNHLGHANTNYVMKLYNSDVDTLTNNNNFFFIYSQGCYPGDFPNDAIAEHFTTSTRHGAAAVIFNSRYGWGAGDSTDGPSQRPDREFWDALFGEDLNQLGVMNADSHEDVLWGISEPIIRWVIYETNLFGDPAAAVVSLSLSVVGSTPAPSSTVATPPTDFVVAFSDPYLTSSVDAGDLLVNGIPADSFILTDAYRVTFHYDTSPVTVQGLQTMGIAAGAILRADDDNPLRPWNASFRYDTHLLGVASTNPPDGAVVTIPFSYLEVNFNEDVAPGSIGTDDLTLSQGSVVSATPVDPHTVGYTLTGINSECTLTVGLAAQAVTDIWGNPGTTYSGTFTTDFVTAPFPETLTSSTPLGSLIYDGSTTAMIGTGSDIDSVTIDLDAGQTLTAVVIPVTTLRPILSVTDPDGISMGSMTAPAAGSQVVMQALPITAAGTYTLTLSSVGGTTGQYTLQLTLNAVVEDEEHGGTSNNTLASAQPLDAAFLELGDSAQRAAVAGITNNPLRPFLTWNMDTNPGWSLQGKWAYGTPTGGGSHNYDPTSGHTGTRVIGYNLSGDYTNNMSVYYATTPAISTLGRTGVTLSFWRWLGVEYYIYDHANVQISTNGSAWTTIWEHDGDAIADTEWTQMTFDISAIADNQPRIYLRWGMGPTDSSVTYPGWNLDDVTLLAFDPTIRDYYRFDLAAGQSASLALASLATDKTALALYDGGNTLLAQGASAGNAGQAIDHFFSPAGGTYYLCVTGRGAPYRLVVTKDAAFDLEPNNSLTAPQDITGQAVALGYVKETEKSHLYQWDDGTWETSIGLGSNGDLLWLNCFDALAGYEEITSIDLAWGPMTNGKPSSVLVYEDPNDDGDPSDAVLLTMADTTVAHAGTNIFTSVPVTPVTVTGKFFVAALVRYQAANDYPDSLDIDNPAQQSWIVADFTPGGLDINNLENNDYPPIFLGDYGNFLLRANCYLPVDHDWYRIAVQSGDPLVISTATPAGGANEFINTLDPYLELYDPSGTRVAWDDNSAPDHRNAQITYTATQSGNYVVQVLGMQSSQGEYILTVAGPTGPLPPFQAITTSPGDGQRLAAPPPTFTIRFNDFLMLTSVQNSDLLVDGFPVSQVTVADGKTLVFTLPGLSEGPHEVTINAGTILDLQGTPVQEFTGTFTIDLTGPRVVASYLHEEDMLPTGNLTYTVAFNEDMDTTVLDLADFSLVGSWSGPYAPGSFIWINPHTLQLQFTNLPDDIYTLTLYSGVGKFQDLVGNALDGEPHSPFALPSGDGLLGGNFFLHFAADSTLAAFPTPLSPKAPLGSLIYDGATRAAIGIGSDTDSFTMALDAGQTLTVVAVPASILQPTLTVTGPGGISAGPVTAAAGRQAVIQTLPVSAAGTYTITVGSAAGTTGYYTLQLTLNAAVEEEEHDGASNDTFASAQQLDAAFLSLGGSSQRAAVLGVTSYPQPFLTWNMDTNPGWSTSGQWAYGTPTGGGGTYYGYPDPTGGHTGVRVCGVNLSGDYSTNVGGPYYLKTTAINCTDHTQTRLNFWRWLNSDYPDYVLSTVDVSNNGSQWTNLYANTGLVTEYQWSFMSYDISSLADNQSTVYIRWGYQVMSAAWPLSGWNVDDVSLLGIDSSMGDYYRFDLAAGQSATAALTSLATDNTTLALFDSEQHLVLQSTTAANASQVIEHFVSPAGGTYYLRVTGTGAPYSLVVTKDAAFDLEPNNSLTAPQDLTGQAAVLGYVKENQSIYHYQWDDGSQESYISLGADGDLLWLNCFDALDGCQQITSIDLAWGPMTNGKPSSVLVYEDPNNDGDPTDAVLLTMADTTVAHAGTNIFTSVPITPVTVTGKFFVAALLRYQTADDFPAPLDTHSPAQRSWIAADLTPGGLDINNLENNDYPPIFLEDYGNFLLRANSNLPLDRDWYGIAVQAGDLLTITTATPAGGTKQFVNTLDPYLELYDPSGTRVAWDDNSAPDQRNAQITYTATQSGNYVVRVLGAQSSEGEYILTVTGPTGPLPPFGVISAIPGDGQRFAAPPPTFTVQFDDFVMLTSVQNSDLLIDGVPSSSPTSPSFPDGKTVVFTLPSLSQGPHEVTIDAGAILDRQATPNQPFTSSFIIDLTGPRVAASSLLEGDMEPAGNLTYTVAFDEDMDTTVLDLADFSLVGEWSGSYTPGSFTWIDSQTLQLQFSSLQDDFYTLTLYSGTGKFQDLVGNALDGEPHSPFALPSGNGLLGGNFFLHFAADHTLTAFPTPLNAQAPLGSLVYNGATTAVIGTGSDTDGLTIALDAGQTLTAVVVPTSTLQPTLTVTGPGGISAGPATAAAAGKQVVIQTVSATAAGTYTITVGSAGGTTGQYTLQLILNAAVEDENHDGLTNNDQPGQNLDQSFLSLTGDAQRAAVLGTSDFSGVLSDELEPNNTTAAANDARSNFVEYTAGNLYQLGITGAIAPGGDLDWYQIGNLDAGDAVTLSMSGSPSSRGTLSDCHLSLYRYNLGNPVLVTSNDDGGPGTDSLIYHYVVTTADVYYLLAKAYSTSYTGTYALGLWLENSGAEPLTGGTLTSEIESNNAVATANDASTSWRPVQYLSHTAGTITSGDVDFYKFQFTAGDLISLNIRSTSPSWRPQVSLLNSTGTVLASENGTSSSATSDSYVYSFIVPTDGMYYAQVRTASGNGAYDADVYLSTPTPPPTPTFAADYYNLTLTEGDTLSVGLKLLSAGIVHVGLWDPDSNDWIPGIPGATGSNWDETLCDYVAPAAGQYVLKIAAVASIDYSLVVVKNAELDVEPNNTLSSPEDLGATRTVLGTLSDDDYFSFSVAPGERLILSTRTPAGGPGEFANNLDPQIQLFDSDDVLLASDDNSAPDHRNAMIAYTFTDPGEYKVRVSAVGATSGEYVLSIVTLEPPEVRFLVTDLPTDGLTQTTLPGQAELQIVEDHPFYGEVWVRSHPYNSIYLGGGTVDLQFNPAYGRVLSVEPVNANWTGGSNGIINNAAGTLTGLIRTDATPSQGDDEWVLFARVRFSGKAPVDEAAHVFGPYSPDLVLTQSTLTILDVPQPTSVVADSAQVYAVIYDINDDGRINSGDFSYFSVAYGGTVGTPEVPAGPYYTWADFDGSGRVLSGDFSWFSTSYRKYTSELDFYDMPNRYRPSAGPFGARPDPDTQIYAVRIPLLGEADPAPGSAPQSSAIASSKGTAGDCPNFCVNKNGTVPFEPASSSMSSTGPAVSALTQRESPPPASAVSAVVLSLNPGTRTRETAVDQLFAQPAPLPKVLAQGQEATKQISANKTQRLALYDATLLMTLDEVLGGIPRLAEKKDTPRSENSLIPAFNLDRAVVEVLAKHQTKSG